MLRNLLVTTDDKVPPAVSENSRNGSAANRDSQALDATIDELYSN